MKRFDKYAAIRGAKVCTAEGEEVRILCYDLKHRLYPIVAAITDGYGTEWIRRYTIKGEFTDGEDGKDDLMMADDDYMEKLARGEYDRPDHIGEATEKVDWDYWRRMYAGMALQGLVASDKWRRMEMGDRVCVCVEMADALIEELKKEKK